MKSSINDGALFDMIINTSHECIFWKDSERRYVGVNRAFLDYFGYDSADEVIGKTLDDMKWTRDASAFNESDMHILNGEVITKKPATLIIRGQERDILVSRGPLYDNDRIVGIVGSFLDITDRMEHEREIEELKKELEKSLSNEKKANRKTAELIGRLRLEIKNPLSAIYSISYMDRYSDNAEVLAYDMRRIHAASNYLTTLSRDLVDISNMENGKVNLEKIECAFEMIVDGIETIIRPLAEEKKLKFEVRRDYDRKKRLVCDPGRIQQIAINLLMNAIRFTDEGKILFSVKAAEVDDGFNVTFVIKDTGCGMSESFIPRMYDEFSQEKRNPNKYGKGSGLGLTVVKRLVELLEGSIEVDSEQDWGTTFTVRFTLN